MNKFEPLEDVEILELLGQNSLEAKEKIARSFINLVPFVSNKYAFSWEDKEEMIAEGNMGMWKAILKLNEENYRSSKAYVYKSIKNHILNYLTRKKYIVRNANSVDDFDSIDVISEFCIHENDNFQGDTLLIRKDMVDYINKILEEKCGKRDIEIFYERVDGQTFETIAKNHGLSKIRCNQIFHDIRYMLMDVLKIEYC